MASPERRPSIGDPPRQTDALGSWVLLAVVIAFGAVLVRSRGTSDVGLWVSWLDQIRHLGLSAGYARIAADYPPGALVMLRVGRALVGGSDFAVVKVTIAVLLIATAAAAGAWCRRVDAATAMFAALVLNALGLGYLDVLFALPLMLALWALQRGRFAWFSALFTLSCFVKWQPLVLVPVLIAYVIPRITQDAPAGAARLRRFDLSRVAALLVPATLVAGVFVAWFGVRPVAHSLRAALGHPLLSATALNVHWLVAWLHGPPAGSDLVGVLPTSDVPAWVPYLARVVLAIVLVGVVLVFWRGARTFSQVLVAAILSSLAYFALATGVHENHLFLPCVLAVVALWLVPAERMAWCVVIAVTQLNLVVFYGVDGDPAFPRELGGVDVTVPLAALVVGAIAWVFWRLFPLLGARADTVYDELAATVVARRGGSR